MQSTNSINETLWAKGLTVTQLAEKAGRDVQQVSKLLNDPYIPNDDHAALSAAAGALAAGMPDLVTPGDAQHDHDMHYVAPLPNVRRF